MGSNGRYRRGNVGLLWYLPCLHFDHRHRMHVRRLFGVDLRGLGCDLARSIPWERRRNYDEVGCVVFVVGVVVGRGRSSMLVQPHCHYRYLMFVRLTVL